jgi:hypothetical protein
MRSTVIPIYEQYLESWDPELQQRAIEYLILTKLDGEDSNIPNMSEIRSKLFDTMPLYSTEIFNNSILMKRIQQTQSNLYINSTNSTKEKASNNHENVMERNFIESENQESLSKLMTTSKNVEDENPYEDHILYRKDPGGFAVKMNRFPEFAVPINRELISNNSDLFKSMITNPNTSGGLIYADHNIKIDLKIKTISQSDNILGLMFLFIPVSANERIEDIDFTLTNFHTGELLNIQISKVKYPDGTQNGCPYPQVLMKAQFFDSFSIPPVMNLGARLGMLQLNINFALPLVITKYLEPCDLSIENFTTMWYEYSHSTNDSIQKLDSIMLNPMSNNYTIMDFLKKLGGLMTNLQFRVFPPQDKEKFHDLEGIAIINSKSVPILFQASFIPSHHGEFRFSLRSKVADSDKFQSLLLDIYSVVKFYINP